MAKVSLSCSSSVCDTGECVSKWMLDVKRYVNTTFSFFVLVFLIGFAAFIRLTILQNAVVDTKTQTGE